MHDIDDLFEYALDLPEAQRQQLFARLRAEEPATAAKLQQLVEGLVTNPDFLCHTAAERRPAARPSEIRRVTLPVADVARAVQWYGDVFGCRVLRRDLERGVMAFGAIELHLVRDDLEPPSLTIVRDDLETMGAIGRRADGARTLRLVDPWGNAIEVQQAD
ncbi:MAG: VOC family protein [Planctomycetes bacterium]|nr:VOC family protein [Planctomycetota bacterium]